MPWEWRYSRARITQATINFTDYYPLLRNCYLIVEFMMNLLASPPDANYTTI